MPRIKNAVVLLPDCSRHEIQPANGTDFSTDELHAAIGDRCITVTFHRLPHLEAWLVVDDDGYSHQKDTNLPATLIAHRARVTMGNLGIVGTAVLVPYGQIK